MKFKDLRIGNWVDTPRGYRFVDELSYKKTLENDYNYFLGLRGLSERYYITYCRPIPLTEEILLKCGFVEDGNKWFNKDSIILGYMTTDKYLQCEIKANEFDTKWRLLDIKYLHQLQNLYFALTEKELEINL